MNSSLTFTRIDRKHIHYIHYIDLLQDQNAQQLIQGVKAQHRRPASPR